MSENEAIQHIISQPKYYIGTLSQSQAASFVRSWRGGSAKRETIESFLNKFGYFKIKEAEYTKKP